MVRYIPKRASLSYSLKEEQYFPTMEELKQYVFNYRSKISKYMEAEKPLQPDDIVIGTVLYDDPLIGWKNVREVCVRRTIDKLYDVPKCIGFCGE